MEMHRNSLKFIEWSRQLVNSNNYLDKDLNYLTQSPESEISKKVAVEKWSKKEILGHLIDYGIYNLQRFTEV